MQNVKINAGATTRASVFTEGVRASTRAHEETNKKKKKKKMRVCLFIWFFPPCALLKKRAA